MALLVTGMSGVALLAGLILLGVAAARYSLGMMAGRYVALIGAVPGANWVWGLARQFGDSGTEGIVGVMALIGVCCAVLGSAFIYGRGRFLRARTMNESNP